MNKRRLAVFVEGQTEIIDFLRGTQKSRKSQKYFFKGTQISRMTQIFFKARRKRRGRRKGHIGDVN